MLSLRFENDFNRTYGRFGRQPVDLRMRNCAGRAIAWCLLFPLRAELRQTTIVALRTQLLDDGLILRDASRKSCSAEMRASARKQD
jgi:hypothetical protein